MASLLALVIFDAVYDSRTLSLLLCTLGTVHYIQPEIIANIRPV